MVRSSVALLLGFVLALLLSSNAVAICNVIPGPESEFRGALGTLNRPFAIPGDEGERIILELGSCDTASPGFVSADPADYAVTVAFTPPHGPPNAVVLSTDCSSLSSELTACEGQISGGSATCIEVNGGANPNGLAIVDPAEGPRQLRFRFPDTDDLVGTPGDDRTLSGPATLAVTASGGSLPCGLATARCADTLGLIACVDELYARDGSCETTSAHRDPIFGHFTALPPANDYQALCTTAGTECTGLATELRLTMDAQGNALIPIDWRGVLLRPHGLPVPRLVRGDTTYRAFLVGGPNPVRIPGRSFLASYSAGGRRLPPIFEPLADPASEGDLTLFGSVDAPVGVMRVARRMPDLTGVEPVYRECTGGAHAGLPCVQAGDCPGGSCAGTACYSGATRVGPQCTNDSQCGAGRECGPSLFDLNYRFADAVGPVLVANSEYTLEAEYPVPIEGLIETEEMFAFVQLEQIAGSAEGGGGPQPQDLNGDGDTTDPVLVLRDRETGVVQPIGELGNPGRAATRVREPPFSYPAVAAEGDVVAFLEPEPLQFAEDANADGDVFDSILRVYRLSPDCGGGVPCAEELTSGLDLAVDAAPLVNGKSVWMSDDRLILRIPEAAGARSRGRLVSSNYHSWEVPISEDGRTVAWTDRNNDGIELHDRDPDRDGVFDEAGYTSTITVAESGQMPALSADGRFVGYNGGDGALLHDRDADEDGIFDEPEGTTTTRVDVSSEGAVANAGSWITAISAGGRFVGFSSDADNLVANDTNGHIDVFVHDRDFDGNGVFDEPGGIRTVRVSVASDGGEANQESWFHGISPDGRYVVFGSNSNNLVAGDTNGAYDSFVHDRDTDEDGVLDEFGAIRTERVNVPFRGGQANDLGVTPIIALSTKQTISADGRFVIFRSSATNLVAGDTNGNPDVFVHDRKTGITSLAGFEADGSPNQAWAIRGSISPDGRYVAFSRETEPGPLWGDVLLVDLLTGFARQGDLPLLNFAWPTVSRGGIHLAIGGDGEAVYVAGADPTDTLQDRSGDGDLNDTLLATFSMTTGSLTTLCPAEQVEVAEGYVAFLRPEQAGSAAGCPSGAIPTAPNDLNADGDEKDLVVHLQQPGGPIENLARSAGSLDVSERAIAALVPTGVSVQSEVHVYDLAEQTWQVTGILARAALANARAVVMLAPESWAGSDLNGDFDLEDEVLHLYDLETHAISNLRLAAEEFVLGESIVAFRISEDAQGETDLNFDSDTEDDVLQVYDLVSGQLFNSGQAVVPCRLQACDPRAPYRVAGDTVTFLTLEAHQGGEDLDGNGDATDLVLQTFNARAAAEAAGGGGGAVPLGRLLFAGPEQIGEASVKTLAGTSAGVCTDTGEACASDADCPAGICFVPPGGCIEDLGTGCICEPLVGCSGCGTGEFCVPIPGGGGAGSCHIDRGPCVSDADCTSPAICEDAAQDIVRLFGPLANAQSDGRQLFLSAGLTTEASGSACLEDSDCSSGEVCTEAGTCEEDRSELISTGAPDTDGDGVVDPFDNCPHNPNAGQADSDADGVGNACNRIVCRDGLDNDGDGAIDLDDRGCISADDPTEEHDCSDGLDNDGDGDADYPDDVGCKNANWATENPECDDGVDNADNDDPALADWDGAGLGDPDPQCMAAWDKSESPSSRPCGLGIELAFLFTSLLWLRGRRAASSRSRRADRADTRAPARC